MKIRLQCPQCKDESMEADLDESELAVYALDLSDDGLLELSCDRGHRISICLRQQRFELLSEVAANAIVDGYYREAVSTFKAALERFYEFYLDVACTKWSIPPKTFGTSWGIVRRQSERQLGAFVFVYLLLNKTKPPTMSDHLDRLRNDVIHNGKIPTKAQALEFGQAVIDVMKEPLGELTERRYAKALESVKRRNFRTAFKAIENRDSPAILFVETAVSLATGSVQQPLADTVREIEKHGRRTSARLADPGRW